MRRRGNKSSKVPNVKLRPPHAGPSSSRAQPDISICWAQDSQLGSDDTTIADLCPRPFKGIVVCATGIVDKPTLFKQALELGATSVSAFTDRVTHLVAVDHGGAKYMCALERKIPILQPSWITESYQTWLRGDDVDLQKSVENHRLPVFSGVVLSPSGITDITRRTQINKLLTHQQGEYVKNLERPIKVTHLLCSGDEETEKMRYAEKFNSRGEANIHLIWEEWFWDSLEFGGRFDEEKYQVRHPRPERKSLAEAAIFTPVSSALPSEHDLDPSFNTNPNPSASHSLQQPEYLDDDGEMASVRHVPAVTLQLWESLLKKRGYEITDGELIRSPSKSECPSKFRDQSMAEMSPTKNFQKGTTRSVISMFRRANSFASTPNNPSVPRRPFRRNETVASVPTSCGEATRHEDLSIAVNPSASQSAAIFEGLKFRALGEAKSGNVRTAIEGRGGMVVLEGETDEDVDYIVVRLVSGSKLFREEADEFERTKYRTECWLERCIFEDRLCPPQEHVSFTPLKIDTPVPGAENVNLSFSGLDQSEACWVRRLVRALGVNLAPIFSRRSTHLLCPPSAGAKFDKAHEWGIPVLSMAWLAEMATARVVPPVSRYLVHTRAEDPATLDDSVWRDRPVKEANVAEQEKGKVVDKGKEKEKQFDPRINDITNGIADSQPVGPMFPIHFEPQKEHPGERGNALSVPLPLQESTFGTENRAISPPSQHRHISENSPNKSLENIIRPNSLSSSAHGTTSAGSNYRPAPGEIEQDRQQVRIPSSMTPSPMKIPRSGGSFPASPAKVSNEVTRALQDSITSLLGKRQPSEEGEPVPRMGKRARPHRSKPQSLQPQSHYTSDAQVSEIAAVPIQAYGESLSPFEIYDELNINDGDGQSIEESMRVMYEDPGQRDEKKRLMSLFEGQNEERKALCGGGKKENGAMKTRRSTRIAGF